MKTLSIVVAVLCATYSLRGEASTGSEVQLTTGAYGHTLTNTEVWSPDGSKIVYDLRIHDAFITDRIEQVDVRTRAIDVLYQSDPQHPCGIVTYNPRKPEVAFVAGPANPTADWHYDLTKRHGVIAEVRPGGRVYNLDAMAYGPTFVAGALRGGSHVFDFDPAGEWVSFTYEDNVLESLGAVDGHDINQRNVGVAMPGHPVTVGSVPRDFSGAYFSAVVTRTVNRPGAGSDEIARAYEEGWVGQHGYVRADGVRQKRALAFQGLVTGHKGNTFSEVFVVDLPDDLSVAGDRPLQGTGTRRPWPPRGTTQRRVTYTENRKYPGIAQSPRHWLRVSPDGTLIAFLMKDDRGLAQLFVVSPNGGAPRQVTFGEKPITSTISWHPGGGWVTYVADTSVCAVEVATGKTVRLTPRHSDAEAPSALACVFAPDGARVAYQRPVKDATGVHEQIFVTPFSP